MIRLDTPSRKLQLLLAAGVAVSQLPVVVSYSDKTSTSYSGGTQLSTTNGATPVDICSPPAASTIRDVDAISIHNDDTAAATVTLCFNDTTNYTLVKTTLQPGDQFFYTHGQGWKVVDTSGNTKITSSGLSITPGKTLAVTNSLTLAGFDGATLNIGAGGTLGTAAYTAALAYTPEDAANKGVANGYASLDGSGLIPSSQLPSYVDDIVEYANLAAFPGTGIAGKIYVALDTSRVYRWSGSAYVQIVASPGTTDSIVEGLTNLYYTNARARAALSVTQNLTYNNGTGVITGPDLTPYATLASPSFSGAVFVTGTLRTTGNAAFGTSLSTDTVLRLSGTALTGSFQYGVVVSVTGTNTATAGVRGIDVYPATDAGAVFTSSNVMGVHINDATKHVSSVITNLYGVYVDDLTAGSTGGTTAALRMNVTSGTGKYNVFASGTAPNYFTGNILVTSGVTTGLAKMLNLYSATEASILLSSDATGQHSIGFRDHTNVVNWGSITANNNNGTGRYFAFNNGGEVLRISGGAVAVTGTLSATGVVTVGTGTTGTLNFGTTSYNQIVADNTAHTISFLINGGAATPLVLYGGGSGAGITGALTVSGVVTSNSGSIIANNSTAGASTFILMRDNGSAKFNLERDGSNNLKFNYNESGSSTVFTLSTTGAAVTGTFSATTSVTAGSVGNQSFIANGIAATPNVALTASGTTTARVNCNLNNTGGTTLFGTENSTGGAIITGTSAYASVFGSFSSTSVHFCTNNAVRQTIDVNGNIYGTAGTTTMTNGFFYIPSAAGVPTGVPTAVSGRLPMYYDSTNNQFYVYNSAWKKVTLA